MVTPLKTLMGFSVHLNVQLKFYNLPKAKSDGRIRDYDAWSRHNGYVWLRQLRADGQYGYLPCRNADSNEAFGKFELLS